MTKNAEKRGMTRSFNLLSMIAFIIVYCEFINNNNDDALNVVKIHFFRLIANMPAYVIRIVFSCSVIAKKLIYVSFWAVFSIFAL